MSLVLGALLALLLVASPTLAGALDLTALSIEELMGLEVTLVSRKPERLSDAAAAVFALGQEDIRRTGATSIPEVLRLVPGLQVARFDANKWAVSARGFDDLFANKLQVLIDGRSVYTPMFSGVFWESQDVMLEDVERVEVIRGPGATLWGSNAVNGIINIVTYKADHTQGLLESVAAGSEEKLIASARYGGHLGAGLSGRVYGKYLARDDFAYASGERAADGWDMGRLGFRLDWDLAGDGSLSAQGGLFAGTLGQKLDIASLVPPYRRFPEMDSHMSGGHAMARWERGQGAGPRLALQFYYDRTVRQDSLLVEGWYENYDLDFQHFRPVGRRQELVWGAGAHLVRDYLADTFSSYYEKAHRRYWLLSGFAQDDVDLLPGRLRLTVGSKLEYHTFTGWEIQPSARLRWQPRPNHTAWAAVSRAVRTPARGDYDMRFVREAIPPGSFAPDAPAVLIAPGGSTTFDSEVLIAFEAGYRLQPHARVFADVAAFYNLYDRLRTYEMGLPEFRAEPLPHLIIPLPQGNELGGKSWGTELALDWQPAGKWRLRAGYTYLEMDLELDPDSQSEGSESSEEYIPRHQVSLTSFLDLPGRVELDLMGRYVDELPGPRVDRYSELDVRLGWPMRPGLVVSLVGQNLLQRRHPEYWQDGGVPLIPTQVERGGYAGLRWSY